MKKILLLLFSILSFQTQAQEELKIDYKEIKQRIEDPKSKDFYPTLLKRYNEFDEKLTLEEYSLIYYGFAYQDNYLKNQLDEKKLSTLEQQEKYDELISMCEKILKLNPVSLKANDLMAYSLYKTDKSETEWKKYQNRYRTLRKVITYSGDGLSCETAFKVIFVSDEYNMLYTYFDIEKVHKQTLVGLCDKFEITPSKYFQSNQVFFDISRKLLRTEKLKK